MSFDEQHEQNLRDLRMIREDPAWALTAVQRWRELEARVDELEAMLRSVLTYVGRSQFLVGADALREEIEDVLLHE